MYSEDDSGLIYKDLALLSHNRTAHHGLYCNEDDEIVMSEIMVIDTKKGEEFYDKQFVTYFESKLFDGNPQYSNLLFINETLKQYRESELWSGIKF